MHIKQIYIYNLLTQFVDIIFNKPKLIKWFHILLCITNNSFKHWLCVYTLLNDETVLFQAIQFSMSFVSTQCKC